MNKSIPNKGCKKKKKQQQQTNDIGCTIDKGDKMSTEWKQLQGTLNNHIKVAT